MRSMTQIYMMAVFGVKYRIGLIHPGWSKELYAVVAEVLKSMDGIMPIEIGGYKDHVHILYSSQGKVADRTVISVVKAESSKWINRNKLCLGRFGWQDGCGIFSYSKGQIEKVRNYIQNQGEHHRYVSFQEEYQSFLQRSGVDITKYSLPEDLL